MPTATATQAGTLSCVFTAAIFIPKVFRSGPSSVRGSGRASVTFTATAGASTVVTDGAGSAGCPSSGAGGYESLASRSIVTQAPSAPTS